MYETSRGTPQSGPIAPMLAHLVFVRFADDFIVSAKTSDILNNIIIPVINQFLERRGLSMSKEKIKEIVQNAYGWSGADLIATLNPIIRGWVYYNKRIVAKVALTDLDYQNAAKSPDIHRGLDADCDSPIPLTTVNSIYLEKSISKL